MHKDIRAKRRRPVKLPSKERLTHIALHYLSRFAASEESLRRVLNSRIRRAAFRDPAFGAALDLQAQLRLDIETIIEKHKKNGVLNDKAYAEGKVNSLRRSGKSQRAIQQKLIGKGIAKDIIAVALADDEGTTDDDMDLKAALILARKKRLGPYRIGEADAAARQKEVGQMARAGFSMNIIRKVLGHTLPEGFEE